MSYYRTCPLCGANLDPGEICECREIQNKKEKSYILSGYGKSGPAQKKNAAPADRT